jgi:hypothetical protein
MTLPFQDFDELRELLESIHEHPMTEAELRRLAELTRRVNRAIERNLPGGSPTTVWLFEGAGAPAE